MRKERKTTNAGLSKQAKKIKTTKRLYKMEYAPFFTKKMEKGAKMLSVAGLPKH